MIVVCVAVISRFFSEPFKFPVNQDDCLYAALLQKYSVWELVQMLPGKYNGVYIAHFDGRVFSNFYSLLVFSILKTHTSVYYLYDLFSFLLLVPAFFYLLSVLIKNNLVYPITTAKKSLLSLFLSCTLYIFLLDGRYEVFYWVSGISNHLLSIVFFVFSLGLFIDRSNFLRTFILVLLSFCFGQMNEVYAVCYFFVFLLLTIAEPKKIISFVFMLAALSLSLYMNLSAYGTAVRFNTLYAISTHFNFLSSFPDTVNTFLLPFINYRYLPIKIPVLICLFLAFRDYARLNFPVPGKHFLWFNRSLLLGAIMSIFLHCYILGEICTYRGLLFYFLCIVYFVFVLATKNTINPVKLFVK
jgi:hypothetical protein